MDYVELDRRFFEFEDSEDAEEAAVGHLSHLIFGQEYGWRDVLTHRFVVILGEAGTGKTTEFQEEAKRVRCEGRASFLIPLEDLADQQISLEIETVLDQWKQGNDDGVFFLDSVDEARLGHPSAFHRGLHTFVRMVGEAGSRARVVVSCRVTDWLYRTDVKTMAAALRPFGFAPLEESAGANTAVLSFDANPDALSNYPASSPAEEWQPKIEVYRLAGLDEQRIARFAEAWGISDVDRFMGSLLDADLQVFGRRPRDLEWLVPYWQEHGAFGNLAEMVEANVCHKLEERNPAYDRRGPSLTAQRCREGAEALATACILCERPLIALPDPELQQDPPSRSFVPAETLDGWTPAEIRALLTRGLFDPATYGRVRFHDPMVQEYLAACWMANRLQARQRLSRVRRFVLGDAFGKVRPVLSKRPVLGWLSLMAPEIRREAIDAAPDVILYCGDASQIPIGERALALKNLAAQLRGIGRSDWTVFDSDIRRIADPQLEPTVSELLQTESDTYEIARLLLRMVKLGPMPGCAGLAMDLAIDEQQSDSLRIEAARAVAAVGSVEQRTALRTHARSVAGLSNRLLGGLCEALFPGVVSVEDCLAIARRAAPEDPQSGIGIGQSFTFDIVDECPRQCLGDLLEGLLDLAATPPLHNLRGHGAISEHFSWTLGPISRLCQRILKELGEVDLRLDLICKAYLLINGCQNHPNLFIVGENDLNKYLAAKAVVHRPIYWTVVRDRLGRQPGEGWFAWNSHNELLALDFGDLGWLLDDVSSLTDLAELETASRTALGLWFLQGRPDDVAQNIFEAVERSPVANDDLKRRVRENLWPPHREETQQERELRERRAARQSAERSAVEHIRHQLLQRVDAIREGADFSGLYQCYHLMRRAENASSSSWAQTNWPAIVADLGEEVVAAARDGFKVWWKSWCPPLPFERGDERAVESGVVVGLTGLAITESEGEVFRQIRREEAETATHYAIRELNGFPDWLVEVAEAQPDAVRDVLLRELNAEFSLPVDHEVPPDVLSSLRYGSPVIRALCTGFIIDQLAEIDLPNPKVLSNALELALAADEPTRARLASTAAERVAQYAAAGDDERMFAWLRAWLRVDGIMAVQFLEDLVAARMETPSSVVHNLASSFGHWIWAGRDPGPSDYLRPEVLKRLIPLVYAHVLPEDDPEHEGVYDSLDPRELAQNFRDWLPRQLAGQRGPEAQRVLRQLATSLDNPNVRRLMARLAEEQAAKSVEYPPKQPRDIAVFAAGDEMEPRTADELFQIALERLADIKADIERGDFSARNLFSPGMPEEDIQRWLANRLRLQSGDRYSVIREEEIDRREEPDIRLHHPTAGCVSIEIKPVEGGTSRYSLNGLVGALRNQLVGQYLRAANSRHGIFVVAMLGQRQWRAPESGERIGFCEVIDRLSHTAREIIERDDRLNDLRVVGIDFTVQ